MRGTRQFGSGRIRFVHHTPDSGAAAVAALRGGHPYLAVVKTEQEKSILRRGSEGAAV